LHHSFTKIYQLTLLLYDGLAEKLLVKLLVLIRTLVLSKEEEAMLKTSVEKLISTCGVQCPDKSNMLVDMLECFAVLTEQGKAVPPLPKPGDVGLLCECKCITPEAQAKAKIEIKEKIDTVLRRKDDEVIVEDVSTDGPLLKFDYYHTFMLCDAINIVVGDKWPLLLKQIEKKTTATNWT